MDPRNYLSKFLFNLHNVNYFEFIIDNVNKYCNELNLPITIINDQNELIDNANCDNCLLGCLELNTGNLIIYQKCINQLSIQYFNSLSHVKDLVTGETVVMGETMGNAMTGEPTSMSLEEIQDIFMLLTKLKLFIFSNLNHNCKIKCIDVSFNENNETVETSVNSIMIFLIQSN
jgi:hypothetical protein